MAVKSVFERCKTLGRTISFTLRYIGIQKHFLKYHPPVCQQKLLPAYVLPYFTLCMEVACWHTGGGGYVQQPKNPGPKPTNAFSTK